MLTQKKLQQHQAQLRSSGLLPRSASVPPSESGVSTISAALTTLTNKDLKGIPVAQKIGHDSKGKGVHSYFGSNGDEMTKETALQTAGGVIWYQDALDASRGRLRRHGVFVGEADARTILGNSKAGSDMQGSRASGDIANLRDVADVDGFISETREGEGHASAMESIPEEPQIEQLPRPPTETRPIEQHAATATQKASSGQFWVLGVRIVLAAVLAYGIMLLANHAGPAQPSQPLLLPAPEILRLGGNGLSAELAKLLQSHESASTESIRPALLDLPQPSPTEHTPVHQRRSMAAAEVERILTAKTVNDILGGGSTKENKRVFQHIVHLIHPDKGLVAADCPRASLALRLAFAARRLL